MNTKALRKLTYGIYLLTAREGERDNGCIVNTAVQVANEPTRIAVAVIKSNLTCDMIARTGLFTLSAVEEDAPYSLFERFGMQSGRTADKFDGFADVSRGEDGLYHLTKYANAFLSLRVTESHDLGSHVLFVGELTDAQVLSDGPSCTYAHYQSAIKATAGSQPVKKGWRCVVCGYIYEGETLPANFVCPICKHGPEDFEPLAPAAEAPKASAKRVCSVCGYEYDPAVGDPEHGVAPGTPWEDVPADWVCPICGMGKDVFEEG